MSPARDGMNAAEWAVLVPVLCFVLACQHCMNLWFAKRVVRQAESTAVEACPSRVAAPPEHPSATDSPGKSSSPHRSTTAGSRDAQRPGPRDKGTADCSKASRPTTAAGLARQAKSDENARVPKHVRNTQPPSRHSSAPSASALPCIAKPSPTVPPIDDRRSSSSFAMRVREPPHARGASVRDDKDTSGVEHLLPRAYVSGPRLESSSSLEEEQPTFAHRNEPPPRPRGMPSLPARSRQEEHRPAGHGAIEACDAAGSSLLSASLQRYYASIEAWPQGASACVTDNMGHARPSPSSFHPWRDQGQLPSPRRRTYRDIHGGKLRSSI